MVYMAFLLVHIPATLLVDVHALPSISKALPQSWRLVYDIALKDDPLLQAASTPTFAWFRSFLLLEIVFQLPTFIIGAWALWHGKFQRESFVQQYTDNRWRMSITDKRTLYPVLTIYGASTATTTLACIATLFQLPGLTSQRLFQLLATYVPFMLVPLAMAIDFGSRSSNIISHFDSSAVARKAQ
ncbi:hypothetical protein OIV83_005701 [Microbotryomycetes sp. JL201]|nr:hypothetical protein OIV83_005701 [Microbotryomycetes sp. JL201]